MQKRTFPIKGMHCQSCEVLITDELEALPGVDTVRVSLNAKSATIAGQTLPGDSAIRQAVETAGYEVGIDNAPLIARSGRVWRDSLIGLVVVAGLFLIFQLTGLGGLVNATTGGAPGGVVALVVGITAGFSTCMALIGGLVLGVASRYAENHPTATRGQKFRPHLFFNLGRVVSFTVFGAIIGAIGSAFQLRGSVLGLLTLLVGVVMLLLGLQLTELFPRLKNVFTLPSGVAKKLGIKTRAKKEYSHTNSFVLGGATFFLPCGFTQAMQLMAVGTGSPVQAAVIMGMFALGTTPGLLGIGGLTSVVKGVFAQRFFRIVGVVVVAMAILNISNGFNLTGANRWLGQVASTMAVKNNPTPSAPSEPVPDGTKLLTTMFTVRKDIVPRAFTAKVGQPTILEVDVQENGQGCMSTIMIPGLDDSPQYLQKGRKLRLAFTPTQAGTYQITCAMGVPRGTLTVVN